MCKIIKKLQFATLIAMLYFENLMGLQNLWKDGGAGTGRYEAFHEKYSSVDGFSQWKADGEYLMSCEFLSELLSEGGNPSSKNVMLERYWVGRGLVTHGFDRIYTEWPEENRDAAIPVVRAMIATYQELLEETPSDLAKTELEDTVKDLEFLESHFQYVINPDNLEQEFIKEQYK